MDSENRLLWWERHTEWALAGAALVFLSIYSVEVLARPRGHLSVMLWAINWAIWAAFVIDYLVRLTLAPGRLSWFYRHLPDLAMVALPMLRPLRLLRLLLLIQALQRAVGDAFKGRIAAYTASGAALLVYVASLAVYDTERDRPGATITSFGKAVWWSITTVTTVGYGDFYPVTTTGRVIAVLLMIGGVSIVGVVTASLARWIIERVAHSDTMNQAATVAHIRELRDEIRSLREELRERADGDLHA